MKSNRATTLERMHAKGKLGKAYASRMPTYKKIKRNAQLFSTGTAQVFAWTAFALSVNNFDSATKLSKDE